MIIDSGHKNNEFDSVLGEPCGPYSLLISCITNGHLLFVMGALIL